MTETNQTIKSASMIGSIALIGALIGFFRQQLVAYLFGASELTDAFFMAESTFELLSKLLLGGSVAAVFLPIFVERVAKGEQTVAWRLALNLLHLTSTIMIVTLALVGIFAEPFVQFIAPGFDPTTSELTVHLLRVLLPAFMFLFLVDLATSMLHALKRFLIPALLRIISPTVIVISLLLFSSTFGIYALAIASVIGALVQFTALVWALHRAGLRYQFIFSISDPTIKKILYLVYPFFYSVIITQGAGIVYRILVSDLSVGSLSALKFAEKITQLITIMFISSVTTVTFPIMSEKAAARDMTALKETIGSAMRLIVFVTLPLIATVSLLRDPLISFIYQHGRFSDQAAAMTSTALLFLSLGLTTNGLSSVLGYATLALQKTRASVAVTICSQMIAMYLFILLVPQLQHAGLALGSSLTPLAIALLYFLYLSRFIPRLKTIFWHPTYLKTIGLTILLVAVLRWTTQQLPNQLLTTHTGQFIYLAITSGLGIILYLIGAYLWRIPEVTEVTALTIQKFIRWKAH